MPKSRDDAFYDAASREVLAAVASGDIKAAANATGHALLESGASLGQTCAALTEAVHRVKKNG